MHIVVSAFVASAFVAVFAAAPAQAQLTTEPLSDDQYHVAEVDGGILRIDRQTGDVTECRGSDNGWVCRLAPDDRLAYEAEINRLDAELRRTREELASAREGFLLAPEDDQSARERMDLPSDDELDAVMDTAEEVMRRFLDMVGTMRAEIEAERDPQ